MIVGVPALGVRLLEPFHEVRDGLFLAGAGLEHEMKMIGHDDVGENGDSIAAMRVGQRLLKGGIIGGLVENPGPGRGAVHDMIGSVGMERSGFAGHEKECNRWTRPVKKGCLTPFLL